VLSGFNTSITALPALVKVAVYVCVLPEIVTVMEFATMVGGSCTKFVASSAGANTVGDEGADL
jgi:hypothetical protein